MKKKQHKCRICHEVRDTHIIGEKNGYKFHACEACGSIMTIPEVTQDVREVYLAEIQPEPTHVRNYEGQIAYCQKRIDKVAQAMDPQHMRFLDVTARQGYTVRGARNLGIPEAKGIDEHDFFATFAQNTFGMVDFEHTTVMEYAEKGHELADIVFCICGIASQPDIDSYMAALAKLIDEDGVIYIEEANGNSMWTPKSLRYWDYADPPFTSTFPSKKGMRILLDRHGLEIEKSYFNWFYPIQKLRVRKKKQAIHENNAAKA